MVTLIDTARAEIRKQGSADWFTKMSAAQQAEIRAAVQLVIAGELTNSALARAILKQYGINKTQNHITMTLRNLANECSDQGGKGRKSERRKGKAAAKKNR